MTRSCALLAAAACHPGLPFALDPEPALSPDVVTQYRYSAPHAGVAPAGTEARAPFTLAWRSDPLAIGTYTASKSSPAVDADHVYVGVDDGRLVALSREDGAIVWTFATRRAERESHSADPDHRGIHGTPAVDADRVYIGDYDGWLYAVDRLTGALVWEEKLGGSIGASPTLHSGAVFTSVEYPTPDGRIHAVDAATGSALWRSPSLGDHPHGTTTLDADRGLALVGANNGRFVAFDLSTGRAAWQHRTGGEIKSTAALNPDTVYVTSWDQHLHALDLTSGAVRFKVPLDDKSMSSPTVHLDRVWFGAHDDHLRCVDAVTGEELWRYRTGGSIVSSPTLLADADLVLVGSRDDHLYVLDATTGALVQRLRLTDDLTGVPVAAGASVFAYDDAGVVWRFDGPP